MQLSVSAEEHSAGTLAAIGPMEISDDAAAIAPMVIDESVKA